MKNLLVTLFTHFLTASVANSQQTTIIGRIDFVPMKSKSDEEKRTTHFVLLLSDSRTICGQTMTVIPEVQSNIQFTVYNMNGQSYKFTYTQKSHSPLLTDEKSQFIRCVAQGKVTKSAASRAYIDGSGILTLATLLHNPYLVENRDDSLALCRMAMASGEAIFQYEKQFKVKYVGNTRGIKSIELDGDFEKSTCVFDNEFVPDVYKKSNACSVDVTFSKVDNRQGRYRIVYDSISEDADIFRTSYQKIISRIPKNTDLRLRSDDPIAKRWNGTEFVDYVSPVVKKVASEQTLVVHKDEAKFPWTWVVVGIVAVVAILGAVWWRKSRQIACLLVVFLACGMPAKASEGPYCGLFCVQAASAAIGRPIEFESIKKVEFLSGNPGSTTDDIVRALAAGGLSGTPRNHLTVHELRQASLPIILHSRSPGAQKYYHWVVFLGCGEDGRAAIFDPSGGRSEITLAELMPVWDGYGIVVSETPLCPRLPISPEWILLTAFAASTYFVLRRKLPRAVSLMIGVIVTAVAWHILMPQGLFQSRRAVGTTTATFFDYPISELDFDDFSAARERGALVVDARTSDAFREAHIVGARNIPITASLLELRRNFESLDPAVPIICYCATDRCAWSDVVANQLLHSGFRDVSVYRGGIAEWHSKNRPVEWGD